MRSSHSFLSYRLNKPFMALLCTLSNSSTSFLYWGCPRPGCSSPDVTSWGQSRHNHLHHPAGHSPHDGAQDTISLPDCKRTLLAHVQLFNNPSQQGQSNEALLPLCVCVHTHTLYIYIYIQIYIYKLALCWTSLGSEGPTLSLSSSL